MLVFIPEFPFEDVPAEVDTSSIFKGDFFFIKLLRLSYTAYLLGLGERMGEVPFIESFIELLFGFNCPPYCPDVLAEKFRPPLPKLVAFLIEALSPN
jgi:hypothetical protein